jgi:hypothetical protein
MYELRPEVSGSCVSYRDLTKPPEQTVKRTRRAARGTTHTHTHRHTRARTRAHTHARARARTHTHTHTVSWMSNRSIVTICEDFFQPSFLCNPETECQRMEWRTNLPPWPTKFSLAKLKQCWTFLFIKRSWSTNNLCLVETTENIEFCLQVLIRLLEVDFERGHSFEGRHLVCFAWSWLYSFCHDSEALLGESQHDGDQPLTLFTRSHASWHFSIPYDENCPQRKKISEHQGHQEHDHQIICHSFVCIWWLFCASVERCKLIVAVREITSKENKTVFFLFHVYLFL